MSSPGGCLPGLCHFLHSLTGFAPSRTFAPISEGWLVRKRFLLPLTHSSHPSHLHCMTALSSEPSPPAVLTSVCPIHPTRIPGMGAGSQGWEGEGAPEGFARRGWVWLPPALCWAWHGLEPPSLHGDPCGTCVGPVWDPCGRGWRRVLEPGAGWSTACSGCVRRPRPRQRFGVWRELWPGQGWPLYPIPDPFCGLGSPLAPLPIFLSATPGSSSCGRGKFLQGMLG